MEYHHEDNATLRVSLDWDISALHALSLSEPIKLGEKLECTQLVLL